MPNLPESVLALFAGQPRAAAMMGDLTEMARTRGRLWFVTAYVRTLIAVGWRTPVALLFAIVSAKYVRSRLVGWLMLLVWRSHSFSQYDPRIRAGYLPYLSHFCWVVSLQAIFCLWIALPYVAVRFGLKNRLTCLAAALFVFAIPVYCLRPQVYNLTGLTCALLIVAALTSPLWRRQMIFLFAACALQNLVFYICINDPLGIFHPHHHPYPMSFFRMRIDDPVLIAITVVLGPLLYHWLRLPKYTEVAHA
jgi:hypothetical protein